MTEFEQHLQSVREIFINCPKKYDLCKEQLKKVDQEILDLLHVLEFTNFNAYQGYKLAKEIQNARNQRRILKNELEFLDEIISFNRYQKPSEKNISQSLGRIRELDKVQKNRNYRMRVREDLQELIK
jgi:hypothetical protein